MRDFKFIDQINGVKVYERDSEVRGTFRINTDVGFAISVLFDTETYHNWLLGDPCREITRFDTVTDLIDLSFKAQKWPWPFRRDYSHHSQTLRLFFMDSETKCPVVIFKSEQFELVCLFENDQMHVSCTSTRLRHYLFSKLTGFVVYAEI